MVNELPRRYKLLFSAPVGMVFVSGNPVITVMRDGIHSDRAMLNSELGEDCCPLDPFSSKEIRVVPSQGRIQENSLEGTRPVQLAGRCLLRFTA